MGVPQADALAPKPSPRNTEPSSRAKIAFIQIAARRVCQVSNSKNQVPSRSGVIPHLVWVRTILPRCTSGSDSRQTLPCGDKRSTLDQCQRSSNARPTLTNAPPFDSLPHRRGSNFSFWLVESSQSIHVFLTASSCLRPRLQGHFFGHLSSHQTKVYMCKLFTLRSL
jgi:hypothetical protein